MARREDYGHVSRIIIDNSGSEEPLIQQDWLANPSLIGYCRDLYLQGMSL